MRGVALPLPALPCNEQTQARLGREGEEVEGLADAACA